MCLTTGHDPSKQKLGNYFSVSTNEILTHKSEADKMN